MVVLTAGGSVTVWVATKVADNIARRLRDEITGTATVPSLMQPLIQQSMSEFKVSLGDYLNGKYIRRAECGLVRTEIERRLERLEDEGG